MRVLKTLLAVSVISMSAGVVNAGGLANEIIAPPPQMPMDTPPVSSSISSGGPVIYVIAGILAAVALSSKGGS